MAAGITAETWVLALDGAKALVFRNEGFDDAPNFQLVKEFAREHPANRDLVSDRPGRFADGSGTGRSAVSQPDHHDLEEADFVASTAAWLNDAAGAGKFDRIAVFAAPRALGRFRDAADPALRSRIAGERDADMTKSPVADIEKAFTALVGDKA